MPKNHTATRFLLIPDLHGVDHDKAAVRIARDFQADFRPHVTIFLGDIINADAVSKYPGAEEAKASLKDEYNLANGFIDTFKPDVIEEGNHDERLRRASLVRPSLREMLSPIHALHIKKRGITWVPYDNSPKIGTYKLGHLRVLHGFWWGQYAARQHAEAYGCCAFGHTHRIQAFMAKSTCQNRMGYNIGCLCKLDLSYTRTGPPRGWCQGFAFGYLYRDDYFSLYQVTLVGKRTVINGLTYVRK